MSPLTFVPCTDWLNQLRTLKNLHRAITSKLLTFRKYYIDVSFNFSPVNCLAEPVTSTVETLFAIPHFCGHTDSISASDNYVMCDEQLVDLDPSQRASSKESQMVYTEDCFTVVWGKKRPYL